MESDDPSDGATVRGPSEATRTGKIKTGDVVFARYAVESLLGKGGMGEVWLAQDRELNAPVALKFLREEMTWEPDALKELKSEVIVNRNLSHANIVKTFDFVTDGRDAAISMEFINGTNLHRLKGQRPGRFFDVEDIQPWVFQLCQAMHYAHQQKVVHRDIKPANLMLTGQGGIKVGDFGIGRTVADTINRVTRNTAGTPPYMSPQQTLGELATPQDDIYSIGATIYDLLTGDPPFFRGAIKDQTLGKVPPPMAQRRAEQGRTGKPIPKEWEEAVAACLAKDAAVRPATAFDLEEMLQGRTIKIKGTRPKKRVGWAAVGGVAAALVVAGGWYFWQSTHPAAPAGGRDKVAAAQPLKPDAARPSEVHAAADGGPAEAAPSGSLFASTSVENKTPVEEFIEQGKITKEEGSMLNRALRGLHGDQERTLATRLLIEHSLGPAQWRDFSSLATPLDPNVNQLRPLYASGAIKEKEFVWLHEALQGAKGPEEADLARALVDTRTLRVEDWRDQTAMNPHVDPFLERVKPLIAAGTVTNPEGLWLRDALAGKSDAEEKALAGQLLGKAVTPWQWRAKTKFSYALPENEPVDGSKLPPAIDLPLNPSVSMRLLRLDPGTYLRGSPDSELGRLPNEPLLEKTRISSAFYIGIYTVTQRQYTALMVKNPSYWPGNPQWPVDQVDWNAVAGGDGYIARLNKLISAHYGGTLQADLPSQDEWEYACRAGTTTAFNNGLPITNVDTDPALDKIANYGRTDSGSPQAVGSYPPNAWGLYDMEGNVSEWCQEMWQRGGSWQSEAKKCRASSRLQASEDAKSSNEVGFRLVLRYRPPADPAGP